MLFIMRGTSCSGKSTFIEKYFDPRHSLSSDDFRLLLHGSTNTDFTLNNEVFDMMRRVLECRVRVKVDYTVWDATCLRFADMATPLEVSKAYHEPVTILSIVPPTLDQLIARSEYRRSHDGLFVPTDVLEKHHARYYSAMPRIIEEAENNPYCTMIEFDQNYDVVNTYGDNKD